MIKQSSALIWVSLLCLLNKYNLNFSLKTGGTSTDVSRYDGRFEHKFESKTAGVTIQYPQLGNLTIDIFKINF